MTKKERINALKRFRTQVQSGTTNDTVSSLSSSVPGWTGSSYRKYISYLETKVKKDSMSASQVKADFLRELDQHIASIESSKE